MAARTFADRNPILLIFAGQVPNRYDSDQRVFAGRGHVRVESSRGVDIQAWICGQVQVAVDAFEILFIIISKKKGVRTKQFVLAIDPPEEAHDRAGVALAGHALGKTILWDQVLVHIRQVGVCEDDIRIQALTVLEQDAPGATALT